MKERKSGRKRWLLAGILACMLTLLGGVSVWADGYGEVDSLEGVSGSGSMLTTAEAVTGLKQTKATATTITLQWKRPEGAIAYGINLKLSGAKEYTRAAEFASTDSTVTYTLKNLKEGKRYDIQVFGADESGTGVLTNYTGKTLTGTPVGLKYSANPSKKQMTFGWYNIDSADGFVLYKYDLSGKCLSRYELKGSALNYTTVTKTIGVGINFYNYRIRGYSNIDGKKVYGKIRSFYTANQPKGGTVTQSKGSTTATVTWSKINGASYEVLMSETKNGNYKRVAKVSGTKTTLKGLKPGKTYYLLIRAQRTIKGKVRTSPDTYVYSFVKK